MVMDCASAELSQVRRQRAAGHTHLVHERGGERLRGVRRERRRGAQGHRLGPAHRAVVPVSRRRVTAAAASRRTSRRLIKFAGDKGYDFEMLKAVERVNQRRRAAWSTKMQAHFGIAPGQDDRALGTRVQAAHRRHARSAGHHRSSNGCCAAGARRCRRSIRRRRTWPRGLFGQKITSGRQELRRAEGRRRARDRHRVERVPRAGLTADAQADEERR